MPKYRVTLQSQTDEHKRYVTLSRVPCSVCGGDVVKRHECKACDGLGDEPATKDSAVAYLEGLEDEFAAFRLDEDDTLRKYPALDSDTLALVEETCVYYPEDTHRVDGRFMRAGKVSAATGVPGYERQHKGWLAFHHQEKPYRVMEVGDTGLVMAVTGFAYGLSIKEVLDGTAVWDWDTDTIKQSLHTSYTVDIDTHNRFDDVSASEVTGTGYTAGGATLGSKTATYDTGTDQARFDAADTSWTTSTISATDAITYKSTGTASTSPLICSLDFGATVSTTAGTFQITHDSTGIYVIDCT